LARWCLRFFPLYVSLFHILYCCFTLHETFFTFYEKMKARWTLSLPQTSRALPVQCCSTHQKKNNNNNVVSLHMKLVSLFMENSTLYSQSDYCDEFVCHLSVWEVLYIQVSFTCIYRSLLLVYIGLFYVTCQSSRVLTFEMILIIHKVVLLEL